MTFYLWKMMKMYIEKVIRKKLIQFFLLTSWRSLRKIAGYGSASGSISQRYGPRSGSVPKSHGSATLVFRWTIIRVYDRYRTSEFLASEGHKNFLLCGEPIQYNCSQLRQSPDLISNSRRRYCDVDLTEIRYTISIFEKIHWGWNPRNKRIDTAISFLPAVLRFR